MKNIRISTIALFVATAFMLFSCTEENSLTTTESVSEIELRNRTNNNTPSGPTIVDIALDDPNFSLLVEAVVAADLVGALSSEGPYTVFAPTNDAFQAFLDANNFNGIDDIPVDALTTVLTTHVLSGSFMASDLSTGYFNTLADAPANNKSDIYINTSGGVTINGGVSVTTPNIEASNGVIHVVNQVIAPSDVITLAASNPNFSILVDALTRPDLSVDFIDILSGAGPFTIVAPTNDAFIDLLNSNPAWNSLGDIPAATLEAVLSYHVGPGVNYSSNFVLREPVVETFLSGETFTFDISFSGGLSIDVVANSNAAGVVAADVQGQNGVIHAIDTVILP